MSSLYWATTRAKSLVDGVVLGEVPAPFAQVCGLQGNAVRQVTGSIALAKGSHRIRVRETHSTGEDGFRVWWRGPGMQATQDIPAAALSHEATAEQSRAAGSGESAMERGSEVSAISVARSGMRYPGEAVAAAADSAPRNQLYCNPLTLHMRRTRMP